ncbi:MAG: hypothetical protein PVSMB8_02990 [Vulcanimicrobiaceae bacterium]
MRSDAYVRARLVTGALFVAFGIAIVVRTATEVGPDPKAVPAYVLGAAMAALGAFRMRDYARAKKRP